MFSIQKKTRTESVEIKGSPCPEMQREIAKALDEFEGKTVCVIVREGDEQ